MNHAKNHTRNKTALTAIILAGLAANICAGICMSRNTERIIDTQEIALCSKVKTKAKDTEIDENLKTMKIPDSDTSFKAYMDYRCITNKASKQYKLQKSAWTDEQGLRRYDDYYMVAMGTYYGSVGDKFKITLENDITFEVIMGDVKADIHTDKNNMYSPVYNENGKLISANVIEFIVDIKKMERKVRRAGSVGAYDNFKGNVVKIEKIERID